jgi:hypothetical protein
MPAAPAHRFHAASAAALSASYALTAHTASAAASAPVLTPDCGTYAQPPASGLHVSYASRSLTRSLLDPSFTPDLQQDCALGASSSDASPLSRTISRAAAAYSRADSLTASASSAASAAAAPAPFAPTLRESLRDARCLTLAQVAAQKIPDFLGCPSAAAAAAVATAPALPELTVEQLVSATPLLGSPARGSTFEKNAFVSSRCAATALRLSFPEFYQDSLYRLAPNQEEYLKGRAAGYAKDLTGKLYHVAYLDTAGIQRVVSSSLCDTYTTDHGGDTLTERQRFLIPTAVTEVFDALAEIIAPLVKARSEVTVNDVSDAIVTALDAFRSSSAPASADDLPA